MNHKVNGKTFPLRVVGLGIAAFQTDLLRDANPIESRGAMCSIQQHIADAPTTWKEIVK